MNSKFTLYANIFHCRPSLTEKENYTFEWISKGFVRIEGDKIHSIGDRQDLSPERREQMERDPIFDYSDHIICPGLIDSHIHFPQLEMIASFGEHLLQWLEKYTFPTEKKYADPEYSQLMADRFFQQLLSHGTTSAMIYPTVHKSSVNAIFEKAQTLGLRVGTGKILMDRNAPDYLRDTAQSGFEDSLELIEQWHGKSRLSYVVTPRFAPTSTPEQLKSCADLLQKHSDIYLQTHLSENKEEILWVKDLFGKEYFQVYHDFGLATDRSLYGHCIHLSENEWKLFYESGSISVFCPTSNSFLGSGLFDIHRAIENKSPWSLATDVGAGTSVSLWKTLGHSYQLTQLCVGMGQSTAKSNQTRPSDYFYGATLGAARALQLEQEIGDLSAGTIADFIVLSPDRIPGLKDRLARDETGQEKLFTLMTLGDDRMVEKTYIAGQCRYQQ